MGYHPFNDLTGLTFGARTVLKLVHKPGDNRSFWLVRCVCGNEAVVAHGLAKAGSACRGCGNKVQWSKRLDDLSGKIFGRWTVLGPGLAPKSDRAQKARWWNVRCLCDRTSVVRDSMLRGGRSNSCRSCRSTKAWTKLDLSNPNWCWLLGLFHGDGCTSLPSDGGGVVGVSCTPPENRKQIFAAFQAVGVEAKGVGPNIQVYSAVLARDFARFKTSGVDKEAWRMPEMPDHVGQWLAGVFDSDGHVRKDGRRVAVDQKRHGGLELVSQALTAIGIRHSRRRHGTRNMESIAIAVSDLPKFSGLVPLRYPKKAERLAEGLLWTVQGAGSKRKLVRANVALAA